MSQSFPFVRSRRSILFLLNPSSSFFEYVMIVCVVCFLFVVCNINAHVAYLLRTVVGFRWQRHSALGWDQRWGKYIRAQIYSSAGVNIYEHKYTYMLIFAASVMSSIPSLPHTYMFHVQQVFLAGYSCVCKPAPPCKFDRKPHLFTLVFFFFFSNTNTGQMWLTSFIYVCASKRVFRVLLFIVHYLFVCCAGCFSMAVPQPGGR